jgi:hypothetical protein
MPSADEMSVQGLAECLEWPIASAAAFWTWATTSAKPDMQALVHATDRLLAIVNGMPDRHRVEKLWRHHQHKYLTPKTLVLGLEAMVEQTLLDRATATGLQNLVLEDTDRFGRWKD